jgi:hypothetical protein
VAYHVHTANLAKRRVTATRQHHMGPTSLAKCQFNYLEPYIPHVHVSSTTVTRQRSLSRFQDYWVKAPVAGSKSNRKPMIYQQLLHRQLRSTVSHHGLKIVFTKNKTYSHQFYLELQKPENPLVFFI